MTLRLRKAALYKAQSEAFAPRKSQRIGEINRKKLRKWEFISFERMKIYRDGSEFGDGRHFEAGSIFGKKCKFGWECTFGNGCEFGNGCWFGAGCEFELASFGDGCHFDSFCVFKDCKFGERCEAATPKFSGSAKVGREFKMSADEKCENVEFDGNVTLNLHAEPVFRDCQFRGNVKVEQWEDLTGATFEVKFQIAEKKLKPKKTVGARPFLTLF